jgi:hypothetical protein
MNMGFSNLLAKKRIALTPIYMGVGPKRPTLFAKPISQKSLKDKNLKKKNYIPWKMS